MVQKGGSSDPYDPPLDPPLLPRPSHSISSWHYPRNIFHIELFANYGMRIHAHIANITTTPIATAHMHKTTAHIWTQAHP